MKEAYTGKTRWITKKIARKHVRIRRHLIYSRIGRKVKVDIPQAVSRV